MLQRSLSLGLDVVLLLTGLPSPPTLSNPRVIARRTYGDPAR